MSDLYQDLARALSADGIRCHFQDERQLVVSSQIGPIWPDRDNSFRMTIVGERWYLFTWAPVGYLVPENADVAEMCRVCMGLGGGAMGRAPADVVERFGLTELSESAADDLFRNEDGR